MILRPAPAALGLLLLGCSTGAFETETRECVVDDDCSADEICDPEQKICQRGVLAPVSILGFDITEVAGGQPQFRFEAAGCDDQFREEGDLLTLQRGAVAESIELAVFSEPPVDPDNPTMDELLAAEFELRQPSRFDRDPIMRSVAHPVPVDAEGMAVTEPRIAWPRYDPDTAPRRLGVDGHILWTIKPTGDFAHVYRMLVPPQLRNASHETPATCGGPEDMMCCPECEAGSKDEEHLCARSEGTCRAFDNYRFTFLYPEACDRGLRGAVRLVGGPNAPSEPIGSATITLRHAAEVLERADDPIEMPLGTFTVDRTAFAEREPQCKSDEDCVSGQFCEQEQCWLSVEGMSTGKSATSDIMGNFSTRVFTYCEDLDNRPVSSIPVFRTFSVAVAPDSATAPPGLRALPTVNFKDQVQFRPVADVGVSDGIFDQALCIPYVGAPLELSVTLRGAPMDLAPDDAGPDVRCCDVGCLPATTADLDGPFDTRSVCSGRTSSGANPTVRFETSIAWTKTLETAWAAANCVEPVETADGSMGTLRRFGECPAERDDCRVADLAGPDAEGPRTYKVRIESPPGSVVGSDDLEIEMPDPQDPQVVVDLPPRVLVRGFVTLPADVCDPAQEEDRDCGSDGAVVLAERLAMPGETTTNTPGPYFHELPTGVHPITGKQGYYVAPLDPGVYVMTALPAGTRGGPAPLIVVDLQESPEGLDRNFELETGKFVQLEIRSFDRRSQVVPIDTGSWQSLPQLLHPAGEGEPVDLNAVGECLAIPSDGRPQACRIRRLTPGSSLPPTQVGQVRFSARDISDGRDCTSRQD